MLGTAVSISLNLGDGGSTTQVSGNLNPKQAGIFFCTFNYLISIKSVFFFSSRLLLLLHLRVEEASYSKSPGER